jgi:hypothetical protein
LVHSIPFWLAWVKLECAVHVALSKWHINQFKPVQLKQTTAAKSLPARGKFTLMIKITFLERSREFKEQKKSF